MASEASQYSQASWQEARDQVKDLLERVNASVSDCRKAKISSDEALKTIRKDVYAIKTVGNTQDFPIFVVIAHRLEDYLASVQNLNDGQSVDDAQRFLDLLEEIADSNLKPSYVSIAAMVRTLPATAPQSFKVEDVKATEVEAMLVVPNGVAGRMVAQELRECGFRVVGVADPFEAMNFAVTTKPDVIIVSAILERLSGIDLVCALKAMPSTRAIPVAFMTSMDHGDKRLKFLPFNVPILYKGPTFADDAAAAFAALGIT